MDNKELTMSIYNQISEAAKEVFSRLQNENKSITPGNYTAAEIEKLFNVSDKLDNCRRHLDNGKFLNEVMRNEYYQELEKLGYWGESLKFSCGEFSCSIVRCSIFSKMGQWESAFRIPAKQRVVFIKEEESEVLASCNIQIPKEAKVLADYASTDTIRPNMCQIYIDIENKAAVSSDTVVLGVYPVEIVWESGEFNKLWIDPKTWKKIAGQIVKVEIVKEGKIAKITTSKGEIFQCEQISGNYPDYNRVLPKVNKDGLFQIEKSDIKKLQNFAKSLPRNKWRPTLVKIRVPAYSDNGIMSWEDLDTGKNKSIKFTVIGSPKIDIEFGVAAYNLYRICNDWNGCIWFSSNVRPLIFDSETGKCTIAMPLQIESEWNEELKCEVPALARKNYDITLSEIKADSKPAYYPVATTEITINFKGMIEESLAKIQGKEIETRNAIWESFEEKLNEDIIMGITDIVSIVDTLTVLAREMSTSEEKGQNSAYSVAETQVMGYTQESYSAPAFIEFPDDCENWSGENMDLSWDEPCGPGMESYTVSDWDNVEDQEYTPPVNIEFVSELMNLFVQMTKLGIVADMCNKFAEIESIGVKAGIIPADIPETDKTEALAIKNSDMNISENTETESECNHEYLPAGREENEPGLLKRIIRKTREFAACFL